MKTARDLLLEKMPLIPDYYIKQITDVVNTARREVLEEAAENFEELYVDYYDDGDYLKNAILKLKDEIK